MLSRRVLRIKAMQVLYTYFHSDKMELKEVKTILKRNIHETYRLFLYQLYCIYRIAGYINRDAEIKASRLLPQPGDDEVSMALLDNYIIQWLREESGLSDQIVKEKLDSNYDEQLIRSAFKSLSESSEYDAYNSSPIRSEKEEQDIVVNLYRMSMIENELFLDHLKDIFGNYEDDDDVVGKMVMKFIQTSKDLEIEPEELDKSLEFAWSIVEPAIKFNDENQELIRPKLVNWELERVSRIDRLLISMALAEVMHIESIPIKVSINEYLEIAKQYSSPKSKDFVNGVLDKIVKEQKEAGKIHKTGRGLIE